MPRKASSTLTKKIKPSSVFAFVDTNVLLHYEFFRDVDWAKELAVSDVTLVFAPVILAELDHHKWSGSRREKTRAQAVVRALDELPLQARPVSIRSGVRALGIDAEPPDSVFARHRLQLSVNDDRLIASVLEFKESKPGEQVLILTADAGLRVKARSRRIEFVLPNERLLRPPEPDDVERELANARRELAQRSGPPPKLTLKAELWPTQRGVFFVQIMNAVDAGIARDVYLELRPPGPFMVSQTGLDGSGKHGLPLLLSGTPSRCWKFLASANDTIPPGTSREVTRVHWQGAPDKVPDDVNVSFGLSAQGLPFREGNLAFKI